MYSTTSKTTPKTTPNRSQGESPQTEAVRAAVLRLADKRLQPYRFSGRNEIRPRVCPFCEGGDNSDLFTMTISMETGQFCCHRGSCGAKGTFSQLSAKLGEKPFTPTQYLRKTVEYQQPKSKLYDPTDEIYAWFESRGISRQTVDAFSVGADEHGNVLFPFTADGELVYVKHRKLNRQKNDPKEWPDRDTRPILFGMDICTPALPLIITEGMIDCMSLYEVGTRNVVSVPMGCENLKWIEECWDWLERFDEFVIFGDNDAPGRRMVQNVIKRLGEARCKVVEDYPAKEDGTECKDANEILMELGELSLMDVLEGAKDIPIKGLINLAKIVPIDPTTIPRIATNIPALDEAIGGLREGAVTVITGKPGAGKSVITGLLLLNAIEQGYPVCAYSGELTGEEFQQWINLQAAGSDYITLKYDPVKKTKVPIVPPDAERAIMDWYDGKFFLYDNQEVFEANQSESIINVFTTAIRKYGCKLFLIDNLLTSVSDSEEETRAQGRFVNTIKRFAKKYGVHVIIVAHSRKLGIGKTTIGQDDISGNSATVKLAHSAIVVERPNLRIIKARDSGHLRVVECCYCPDSKRVYQKDKGDLNNFSWDKEGVERPSVRACDDPDYQVQVGDNSEGGMML